MNSKLTVEEQKTRALSILLAFVLSFIVILPYSGFVFQYGWNNFMEPITGIHLPFLAALGILELGYFVTQSTVSDSNEENPKIWSKFFLSIFIKTLFLIVFWVIKTLQS